MSEFTLEKFFCDGGGGREGGNFWTTTFKHADLEMLKSEIKGWNQVTFCETNNQEEPFKIKVQLDLGLDFYLLTVTPETLKYFNLNPPKIKWETKTPSISGELSGEFTPIVEKYYQEYKKNNYNNIFIFTHNDNSVTLKFNHGLITLDSGPGQDVMVLKRTFRG